VADALLAGSNFVFTTFLLPRSGCRGTWWPAACPVSIRRTPGRPTSSSGSSPSSFRVGSWVCPHPSVLCWSRRV